MPSNKVSLRECALMYLVQWEQFERSKFEKFSENATTENTYEVLKYFGVARTFRGLAEEKNKEFIVRSIHKAEEIRDITAVERVIKLASILAENFNSNNISAASKMLWMRSQSPYIIYDTKAWSSINTFGHSVKSGDYTSYCAAWQEEYAKYRPQVEKACLHLHIIHELLPSWFEDEKELDSLLQQPWFQERVFDIYLWKSASES